MGNAGTGYITRVQAAEILGTGQGVVRRLVEQGVLTPHGGGGRGNGSLDPGQVRRVAARRARAQAERESRASKPRGPQLPDQDHDWLTTNQAAELLGRSRQSLDWRCGRGTIPHELHDGKRWFRRDLLELWSRARTARNDLDG